MRYALAILPALALLQAGSAHATCPPHELLLQIVRAASRIQVEQLGSEDTRVDTPLAHVPGRTLGYEVAGVFRVSGAAAAALQRAFSRRDSYACDGDTPRTRFETPGELAVGLLFASRGGSVAVVLHLPEGMVEMQLEGGAHMMAPMSQAGQRRWEEALLLLSRETRTSPGQFYEQMLPPMRTEPVPVPVPAEAPADTARAPRDASRPSR